MIAAKISNGKHAVPPPEWLLVDKKKGVPDKEIYAKLRLEIYNEVMNKNFSLEVWTDDFVNDVAKIYFDYFNKIQHQYLH